MRIVTISDTHSLHGSVAAVPDGDVLIHAGDLMNSGWDWRDIASFNHWLSLLPHKYKIVIGGNHDWLFQRNLGESLKLLPAATHYLQDSGVTIEGFKFWGSPWQPEFNNWAFNVPRGQLHRYWDLIPNNTDVLITHGPPYGILDTIHIHSKHLGCDELLTAVDRVKPQLHVFGHIHGGRGVAENEHTKFVNASALTERYFPYPDSCYVFDLEVPVDNSTASSSQFNLTASGVPCLAAGNAFLRTPHVNKCILWSVGMSPFALGALSSSRPTGQRLGNFVSRSLTNAMPFLGLSHLLDSLRGVWTSFDTETTIPKFLSGTCRHDLPFMCESDLATGCFAQAPAYSRCTHAAPNFNGQTWAAITPRRCIHKVVSIFTVLGNPIDFTTAIRCLFNRLYRRLQTECKKGANPIGSVRALARPCVTNVIAEPTVQGAFRYTNVPDRFISGVF